MKKIIITIIAVAMLAGIGFLAIGFISNAKEAEARKNHIMNSANMVLDEGLITEVKDFVVSTEDGGTISYTSYEVLYYNVKFLVSIDSNGTLLDFQIVDDSTL